jgi:tRNA-uridine 2-sulfurtransferase
MEYMRSHVLERSKNKLNKTILVGMSGGVDSTLAAYLLKEQGHTVIGITMSIWDKSIDIPDLGKSGCYGPGEKKDIEEAKNICKKLGIEHLVVDLSKEYKKNVLEYFSKEYMEGKTPNPCVMCNQRIKFGALLEKVNNLGISFDYFATGHYVRAEYDNKAKRYLLKKALDSKKDQSYFLSRLKQEQLKKVLFPLGNKTKEEIKDLARTLGFKDTAEKKESQDFIETDDYSVLFKKENIKSGDIVDSSGNKLGTHKGIVHYTVGQRKGLGINAKDSNANPLYVSKIDAKKNQIIVGEENLLMSDELIAENLNWIAIENLETPMQVHAKIRQQHREAEALISPMKNSVLVKFKEAQRAISPGQVIVFYNDNVLTGSGIIK